MRDKKFLSSALVVVIIIAIGVAAYVQKHKSKNVGQQINYQRTDAEKGQVVKGFPSDMALSSGAVQSSYELKYDNGLDQFTDVYTSKYTTVKAAYDAYKKMLTDKGYLFFANPAPTDTFGNLYATTKDDKYDVNVVIQKVGSKINITTTYLIR